MSIPVASVIIPTYNGLDLLPACLDSVVCQSWQDREIIVVDNGSTDGTAAAVAVRYPTVRMARLPRNEGYAGAGNHGATVAQGTWLVFLNNDTVVPPDWLEQLMVVVGQDASLGICSSKVRLLREPGRLDAVGSYLTPSGFLRHIGLLELDRGQHDALGEFFSVKGVALAVRRELFHAVGGFDARYVSYFEESDLCWRVWLRGYRVGFAPRSLVYHRVGGTASRFHYAYVDYHSFKNRIRTILKNAGRATLIWMLPLHLACCLGLIVVNTVWPRRWANGWAILRAIGWNVWHWPDTWRARRAVQGNRRLSDAALFRRVLRPIPVRDVTRYAVWMVMSRERMRARLAAAPEDALPLELAGERR